LISLSGTKKAFQYKQLQTDSSIRIAALHPGAIDDKIEIPLKHFDLEREQQKYEAVSSVLSSDAVQSNENHPLPLNTRA
jgi:hypothetical protein